MALWCIASVTDISSHFLWLSPISDKFPNSGATVLSRVCHKRAQETFGHGCQNTKCCQPWQCCVSSLEAIAGMSHLGAVLQHQQMQTLQKGLETCASGWNYEHFAPCDGAHPQPHGGQRFWRPMAMQASPTNLASGVRNSQHSISGTVWPVHAV